MAKINTNLRNDLADQMAAQFPAGAILDIYSGSAPSSPNNAATGTLLASITLPSTPWASASSGSVAKQGTWQDTAANATGTAGYARLRNSGDTRRLDFSISASGGGGEVIIDSTSIVADGVVTVTSLSLAVPE